MSYFMTDVEADGPCPGIYSMISFGSVIVAEIALVEYFYGKVCPISGMWIPEALAVSGFTREETLMFDDPKNVMQHYADWIEERSTGRPQFISDNNGFDWQFINYYFHYYLGKNPFGHSSRNLGDLYKGMQKDMHKNFKHLRKTKHTHNPVDDSLGNVEALLTMKKMGLKIKLD